MSDWKQDLRYAIRTLAKSPVFTLVAVLSLALGVGANTAIFTLIDQLMLRLLPVQDPKQLVLLTSRGSHYGNNRGGNALSYPMYRDFRDQNQVFSGVLCRYGLSVAMGFNGQTERVAGELVSGNYFDVLGVKPALGRTFTPEDDRTPGGHPLVVLNYSFWKTRFGSDPGVLGKRIYINNYPMTIIGVSEEGFDGTEVGTSTQVRIPVAMKALMTPGWDDMENRRGRWVNMYCRVKPGVTLEQAKASLQPIFHQILSTEVRQKEFNQASPYTREQFLRSWMDVLPAAKGRSNIRQQFSTPLLVLMTIVALVLLIACANVANLLIARATARQKEVAVRLALGASRGRIVTQLLIEGLVLSLAGGALGLGIASGGVRLLLGLVPQGDFPLSIKSTPDLRILGFNLAVSVLTAVIFALVPALKATRPDVASTLKDQAGSVSAPGGHVHLRKALVVAQVALSLLLLIGAGLFLRSLRNLKGLDPGFRTTNLLAFELDPVSNGYRPEQARIFHQQLFDRIRAIPGVQSAALAVVPVLANDEWDSTITVEGYQAKPGENMNPYFNGVSPDYFATLGIPLLAGRDFKPTDIPPAPPDAKPFDPEFLPKCAVVNEKLALHYFGTTNAVGRHIGFGGDPGTKTPIEIVGVIKDAKYTGMRDEIPRQVFVPFTPATFMTSVTVYVRTTLGSSQIIPALRREVQQLDANLPLYNTRTLEAQLDNSLMTERLIAGLSTVFGMLATLLACIGLYGVMAYSVARRTREIGMRIALGADGGNILWLVMREVLILVGIGISIGLPAAWAMTRFVRSQLYGIEPHDPTALVLATAMLAAVALFAGFIPAWRATRVDPIQALRYE